MTHPFDPNLRSWVPCAADSDFPIQNIPFGIATRRSEPAQPFAASIIGARVMDLSALQALGAFEGIVLPPGIFRTNSLNDFIRQGKTITRAVRERLIDLLRTDSVYTEIREAADQWLIPVEETESHLPVHIGDYTDFYSSEDHATNVGKMFRDAANALLPNWKHLPVGYHGRASSIVVSGHSFHRPKGQIKPEDGPPLLGPTRLLDFELEMGFIIGRDTSMGDSIPIGEAEEHLFGLALFNDWSARDIQRWEYVPLGPFLAKNFASTLSPWIVTMEALEPFRVPGPVQDPPVLDYLAAPGLHHYDIHLEVAIQPFGEAPATVCRSNFRHMYWSMVQQLAHHTVNGCNVRVGDLYASGTISGPTEDSYGSMLELSWKGTREVPVSGGQTRKFVQDGDTVILRGHGHREGVRIGFGECSATVLPARE
jgi:fumarylacetoacetase